MARRLLFAMLLFAPNCAIAEDFVTIDKIDLSVPISFTSRDCDATELSIDDEDCDAKFSKLDSLFDEFYAQLSMDGSKQPQDFGVNAHAGLQVAFNWGIPLLEEAGVGFQVGSNLTATQNAVQVFELLGESTARSQSFTTVGFFQRLDSGFAWGAVYDFLYADYFDHYSLGQWRLRTSYLFDTNEFGITSMLRSTSENAVFGNTPVNLQPINQGNVYWRHYWPTHAQTTFWAGIADRHSEDNAVTGRATSKDDTFLYGADVLMPLTQSLALYGEANMIMPFDTGTVDAFLGIQWYPGGNVFRARRGAFSPLLPVAAPTSFSVDLLQ
jgi:hypothetical protein